MIERSSKRLTVFISSTFTDLKEYREAARSAILSLRNHASDMIYWSADERDPTALSLDELRQSDLVILLLAHRYGTIPPSETRSITEIEFDTAKEAEIPIIAFLVDKDHDWPGSRFGWKQYGKLLAFKEKVEQHCTPKFFTTPESLGALVTQAVANFDKRHRAWLYTPREWSPPLAVNATKSVDEFADTLIQIGPAEDGLPMVLAISRSDNLDQPLAEIAKVLGTLEEAGIGARLDSYVKGLLKDAERVWKTRGICEVELPSGDTVRCYMTKKTVSDLFSSSVLAFLLPAPVLGDFQPKPERKISTEALLASGIDVRVQSTGGQNRFLAVSLSGEQRFVVGRVLGKETRFRSWHNFIHESLRGFPKCEYEFRSADEVLSEGQMDKYPQNLKRDFEPLMDDNGRANTQVTFRISRQAIGQAIQQILERLENDYHKRKIVHGDVKPQNCLVTLEGAMLIDSLELGIGEISPALSPIWAAPEQVAMRTVSEATDIYPIGLMLVSLLSGQVTGEIVRFQVPSEDEGSTIVSFIRNPLVYLNPKNPTIPVDGRKAWLEFIEKCLRFDPSERFPSTGDCTLELSYLLDEYPPLGWLSLQLQRGELQMVRLPNGDNALCRILHDERYGGVVLRPAELLAEIPVPAPAYAPPPPGVPPTSSQTSAICPQCGAQNPLGAAFCDNCGTAIRTERLEYNTRRLGE